jgi:adenosylhomocysteine nucleosidase
MANRGRPADLRTLRNRSIALVAFTLALFAAPLRTSAQAPAAHPIAIIGITGEIAPVEARMQAAKVTRIQGVIFTSGTIGGASIVAARSGAGKVNAAIATTLLVDHFTPSAVVFTGTAGAIGTELNPADVVIGTSVGYHDFGDMTTTGFVRSPTRNPSTGIRDPDFFPADPKLLEAARRAAKTVKLEQEPGADPKLSPRIREGRIVTGDAFVANPMRRVELRRELNASAVEMEGAAVAQVCAHLGVPAIVIRSITDHADGGAENSYERFVGLASRNAAEVALAAVHEMLK